MEKIKGGVAYYEYLHSKIKHSEKVFGATTKFIYKEYSKKNKEDKLFFEQNGFKKPYPVASLGIRIAFRDGEL